MNDVLANYISRGQKVTDFITDHTADLAATPDVTGTLHTTLQKAIGTANEDDAKASADTTGYSEQKQQLRTTLQDDTFHLSSALVSYADDNNDFVMMNMFDFTYAAISKFRENRLLSFAEQVLAQATDATVLAALKTNHNVTDDDIAALQADIESFNAFLAKPKQQIGEKSAWNKQVERDVQLVNDTVDRIARKMATYRKTNPFLFDAFEAIRKIDDMGHGGGDTATPPVI